jgi:hypothetical protein
MCDFYRYVHLRGFVPINKAVDLANIDPGLCYVGKDKIHLLTALALPEVQEFLVQWAAAIKSARIGNLRRYYQTTLEGQSGFKAFTPEEIEQNVAYNLLLDKLFLQKEN